MSDRWVMATDPREGEHPDEADICAHGQMRESCGKCHDEEIEDGLFEMKLAEAFNAALARIEGKTA